MFRTEQIVAFDMDSKMQDGRLGLLFKDNFKKPQIWFQVSVGLRVGLVVFLVLHSQYFYGLFQTHDHAFRHPALVVCIHECGA